MSLEEQLRKDAESMREVGWFNRAKMYTAAADEIHRLEDRIKRLEAVTNDPHALWANWLRGTVTLPVGIGDVREYQERIKRLEEAGDMMVQHFYTDEPRSEMWDKAKEVKP